MPNCSSFITSGEYKALRFRYDLDETTLASPLNFMKVHDLDPKHLDILKVLFFNDDFPIDFDWETLEKIVMALNTFKELIIRANEWRDKNLFSEALVLDEEANAWREKRECEK